MVYRALYQPLAVRIPSRLTTTVIRPQPLADSVGRGGQTRHT